MPWIAIAILSLVIIGLVIFTIIQNQKDKNEFVNKLNSDYPKKKDKEGDIEIEE